METEQGKIVADTGFQNLDSLACEITIELEPRKKYYWSVQEKNIHQEKNTNQETIENCKKIDNDIANQVIISEKSYFETGKMNEPFTAKWITCEKTERRLPYFEKSFILNGQKKIRRARLYQSGLGLYETYMNGEEISGERLAPGSYCYQDYVQIWTYDVTKFIKTENRISVLIGDGWYKGRYHFGSDVPGFYGDSYLLLSELHVEYEDGTKDVIATDDSWEVRRSNILFSGIYDGEIVDDTLLELPLEKTFLYGKQMPPCTDRISLPVIEHEEFIPKLILTPKGETVLDLDQNMAGSFRMKVNEAAGAKIHLQFGEVLQDGCFYRENLRSAKAEYIYISDGKEHILRPHFTYYGYRYVKVEGVEKLDPNAFTGIALYSDMPIETKLVTGNEKINQLISNTIWGMKSNFVDVPTDCPQRDERMGWTGDTQVFSETACYLGNPYVFYRKYLYDTEMEKKRRDGAVPDVIPAGCKAIVALPLSAENSMELTSGTYEYSYETCKPVFEPMSVEDKLKELLLNYDVRSVIRKQFPDIYDGLSFTGNYPFRETLTNWGYDTEFIERINQAIGEASNIVE